MKKTVTKIGSLLAVVAMMALVSCSKDSLTANKLSLAESLNALAVAADTTSDNAVYIIHTCDRGSRRDSVSFSSLPAPVATYLTANYSGYTFTKAFKVTTKAGAADGFIVVIQFNGKPVGLKFDTAGTFVKVFEQREKRDLDGKGWRQGGRFDARDGLGRDTIAISALPAAIKTYFASNYASDTLLHAATVKDGSILVISANNGLFATAFKSDNTFIKRGALPAPPGKKIAIAQTALPVTIQSYLTTTYPSYVFDKAFSVKVNAVLKGYVVLIDANATKYAIQFDANGIFVKNLAVR
jgi:hypothetical protein